MAHHHLQVQDWLNRRRSFRAVGGAQIATFRIEIGEDMEKGKRETRKGGAPHFAPQDVWITIDSDRHFERDQRGFDGVSGFAIVVTQKFKLMANIVKRQTVQLVRDKNFFFLEPFILRIRLVTCLSIMLYLVYTFCFYKF